LKFEFGNWKLEVGMPSTSYLDILAYQNAMKAISPTMKAPAQFPSFEKNRLVDQIRRAAQSVPANIAEGYGHQANQYHYIRYLSIAMGSCNEYIARW